MRVYQTKSKKLVGTNLSEIRKKAFAVYSKIKSRTKRKPYVRSAYFKKDKVFLDLFWAHLFEKGFLEQLRRMKLFPCAIEVIRLSHFIPITKENPNRHSELLHRFYGESFEGELFCVQIKEDKASNKKWLISLFPTE